MDRISRSEAQQRNRARVLAAARDEFAERGYRDATVDRIAERAALTRGAVYSNFAGKRALYFSVLAEDADESAAEPRPGDTVPDALGALAHAWLARLPLTGESGAAVIGRDLMPEIMADAATREAYAQVLVVQSLVLGLALESLDPNGGRRVPTAAAALTTLHGAGQLAAAAPGFADPFDVVAVCRGLAGLDLGADWHPPYAEHVVPARPADEPWSPPPGVDALRAAPVTPTGDGVVAVLGLHRLEAVEEAVRLTPHQEVTAVVVTGEPRELGPLVRLGLAELRTCLRHAVPAAHLPRLRVVHDESGALAAAAGIRAVSDATESAVRVRAGRIVARADGRGACHAVARR